MARTRSVLLTGGGTGGHLAIVEAVAEVLAKRGVPTGYVGSLAGQDRAWFEGDRRFLFRRFLATRGVVNRRGLARAAALGAAFRGAWEVGGLMRCEGVGAVLSVGGFSAAPASLAAVAGRVPLLIHEQNALPGRLNRLLRPFARRLFNAFAPPYDPYPVRPVHFEKARLRKEVRQVIFLGGSQGARAINDFALETAPWLLEQGIGVMHQCGEADHARVSERYRQMGVEVELFAFDRRLHERLARADLAVSRAGAGTLWELAAHRLPALFVPYPHAASDHQYHNARFLADRGGGWVVRQERLASEALSAILQEDIEKASRALAGTILPGGAERLADALEEAAGL